MSRPPRIKVEVELSKDSETIWLHFKMANGRQAAINLMATPFRQRYFEDWAEEKLAGGSDFTKLLAAVRQVNELHSLGEAIYDVRDNEDLGWEGPQVTAYSVAVAEIERILETYPE